MQKRKTNTHDTNQQFNTNDTYGVFSQEMEIDSDINEDQNRELLLDESVDAFIEDKMNQEMKDKLQTNSKPRELED
ncbi:hypothetical protein [Fredinandcohnia sp. 179-A 10B2 NHS]|uniref:hypothetical protein n=1 Tax=Fredinandcohnia sp. 179-A 10B2 NHS TaxID=3235176 RepID=UPI0039A1D9BE